MRRLSTDSDRFPLRETPGHRQLQESPEGFRTIKWTDSATRLRLGSDTPGPTKLHYLCCKKQ